MYNFHLSDPQTSLYTCHVCNSNYNHSGNFKQHLLKHERESGSISATLVAQAGSNPHLTNVLQSAMADRVDSGDKPAVNLYQYQCEHCDRSFKHPGNYKQHLASHMRNSNTASAANASSISNTLNKVNSMFGQLQHPSPPSIAGVSKLDSRWVYSVILKFLNHREVWKNLFKVLVFNFM